MGSSIASTSAPGPFARMLELYLEDMQGLARLTTKRSVAEYRRTLRTHAEDAAGTDPRETTREHVKGTLRRWDHLGLVDVLSTLLDELPEDAFPGEQPAEVLMGMLTGTLRPAAEAAGERAVREATALPAAAHDRAMANLRAAAERASRR